MKLWYNKQLSYDRHESRTCTTCWCLLGKTVSQGNINTRIIRAKWAKITCDNRKPKGCNSCTICAQVISCYASCYSLFYFIPSGGVHSLHLYLKLIQGKFNFVTVQLELPLPKVHCLKRENTRSWRLNTVRILWNQAENNLILLVLRNKCTGSLTIQCDLNENKVPPGGVCKQTLRNDTSNRQGFK